MNFQDLKNSNECPRTDIAAYIDGELTPREELELEIHLAACKDCAEELNQQKKLLCALDFALEENEIELPENFTKVVVANAESRVSGLRRPNERFNALFICSALFLLVFVGFGSEAKNVLTSSTIVVEQFLAIGGFITHLMFDVAIGATVVLRSLCLRFVFNSAASLVLMTIVFGFSALIFSRLLFRYKRM
ncbi:MAG: anti-sigma factor family protein [Pyrinomonadaceae bacterium]